VQSFSGITFTRRIIAHLRSRTALQEQRDNMMVLLPCNHLFLRSVALRHLEIYNYCPGCRRSLYHEPLAVFANKVVRCCHIICVATSLFRLVLMLGSFHWFCTALFGLLFYVLVDEFIQDTVETSVVPLVETIKHEHANKVRAFTAVVVVVLTFLNLSALQTMVTELANTRECIRLLRRDISRTC
jgi:hypothetical protein